MLYTIADRYLHIILDYTDAAKKLIGQLPTLLHMYYPDNPSFIFK